MKDLDHRLAALGRVEIDHDLSNFERDVLAEIDARARLHPVPRSLAAALCFGAALLASTTGAGVAAASASAPASQMHVIDAPFAPSTLLSD